MVQMEKVETGTTVKIRCKTWSGEITQEGIMLPATAEGYITLKLVNGYNVSYQKEMLLEMEIINKPVTNKVEEKISVQNVSTNLPLVTIIHTGGTIASKVDYETGAVVARFEPEELLAANPEIGNIARIDTIKLGNMWSDDIRPTHWNKMIEATKIAFQNGSKGIVIAHGTDTMHISAAALAFAWSGNKEKAPGRIVFTGSQRSSDRGSSDASENLLAATYWAAYGPPNTGEMGDSTVIVMHANSSDGGCVVLPGVNSRKNHSTKRAAFQAVNSNSLANISINKDEINLEINEEYLALKSKREICIDPKPYDLKLKIAQLVSGPHLTKDMVTHAIDKEYSGIVFSGTGLGHLPIHNPTGDSPENPKLAEEIREYISRGGIAVMTTQCINGPINMNVYSKGRDQQEIGILGQQTTNSIETASVKLLWMLSNIPEGENKSEWIRDNWSRNLVGENPLSLKD